MKYRFDKPKLRKLGISLLLAACGGAALAVLEFLGALEINDPLLAELTVILVPWAVNAVRVFIKGQ